MSRQKAKGTLLESKVVNYLRARLGDSEQTIHREVLHGTKDQGDITGLRIHGRPVVLECKNYSTYAGRLKEWMQEGRTEAGKAGARVVGSSCSSRRVSAWTRCQAWTTSPCLPT